MDLELLFLGCKHYLLLWVWLKLRLVGRSGWDQALALQLKVVGTA
jgi:hypothetical protein